MAKGKLIVIEGLDGSGKATQTGLLCRNLAERWGSSFRRVSFPDYDDPSSALVKLYLGGELGGLEQVNAYGASLFYTVDRYASYLRHWGEDYKKGFLIVADRYATSNIAHQMPKLPRGEWDSYLAWLGETEYTQVGIPRPDKVIYLDMAPETSRKLLARRYTRGREQKGYSRGQLCLSPKLPGGCPLRRGEAGLERPALLRRGKPLPPGGDWGKGVAGGGAAAVRKG